jgi:ribA/ribD-fused uncharacterized protein
MERTRKHEVKIYNANECCVFRKTKEQYGGLSNMASGFPIVVNRVKILSSEALYQACRFPHLTEIQKKIIAERSPMTAKMVGKPFRSDSRNDWDEIRIKIMRWCLRVKLAQNFVEFGRLLETTSEKPIVEDSSKDDFWGAIRKKENENILEGVNALGRLLMELRQFYNEKRYSYEMFVVEPLPIPDFKLFGQEIGCIDERQNFIFAFKVATNFEFKIDKNISESNIQEYIIKSTKSNEIEQLTTTEDKKSEVLSGKIEQIKSDGIDDVLQSESSIDLGKSDQTEQITVVEYNTKEQVQTENIAEPAQSIEIKKISKRKKKSEKENSMAPKSKVSSKRKNTPEKPKIIKEKFPGQTKISF